MPSGVEGKVVAITGASSGIGEAAALLLAQGGAKVVLGARRSGAQFGKLDVLVNNAGVAPNSLLDELRIDDWDEMIDVNLRGVLYGIAAALPVFRRQGFGHFVNIASTAGLITKPTMAVYSGTKFAVRAISEGLRQEAGSTLRVTLITPGFVKTNLVDTMTNPDVRAQIADMSDKIAIPPNAIARAIAFAIEQSGDVDVGEIVVRPTAQA